MSVREGKHLDNAKYNCWLIIVFYRDIQQCLSEEIRIESIEKTSVLLSIRILLDSATKKDFIATRDDDADETELTCRIFA